MIVGNNALDEDEQLKSGTKTSSLQEFGEVFNFAGNIAVEREQCADSACLADICCLTLMVLVIWRMEQSMCESLWASTYIEWHIDSDIQYLSLVRACWAQICIELDSTDF